MKLNLKTNTNIVYGRGILEKYGTEMLKLGEKPLIVSGKKSSKNSQGYKDLLEFFKKNDIKYSVYIKSEIMANIKDIEEGAEIGRKEKCDYVVAVGGGTTIDIGKGISILLKNKSIKNRGNVPLVTIPTISGSGSETSKYAVINLGEINFYTIEVEPNMAIVDPYYTNKINIELVKNSSLNGLSNLIEGYLNENIDKENERIAIEGLRRFGESIDNLLDCNISSRDRENLSMASILGGILLNRYGRGLFNVLGETLSYNGNLSLGKSKGILYNEYLKRFRKEKKLNNIINVLGFSTFRDLSKTINKLSSYNKVELEKLEVEKLAKISMQRIIKEDKKLKNEIYYDIFNIYSNSLKNRELNYDII
ncbi:iron-containing alcohol dehydrogenase [Clostridium thermobutyricum]|uniref:iron-containing alcohol dehydrogenase n=1 Tax=Clostridium thermobutyricum TaxID=29372 RepID=UPI003F51D787